MNPGAKLAAYGFVLAGMVGGGAALGSAVGPISVGDGGGGDHPTSEPACEHGDAPDTTSTTAPRSHLGSHGK